MQEHMEIDKSEKGTQMIELNTLKRKYKSEIEMEETIQKIKK